MLKESGNLITENIPMTKELLDFAKANNYNISLKTGDYIKEPLKVIRSKNNQKLVSEVAQLYINKELYPPLYFEVFGFTNLAGFVGMLKRALGEAYIECTILYPEEIQEKHRQSCLLNLGVEYPSQSKVMRAKTEATNLRKYGVKCSLMLVDSSGDNNCMKRPEVRAKARATCLVNHGVEYPMQSGKVRDLSKSTCLEKYGVDNPMKSEMVQEKFQATMVDRYGEPYALQSPILKDRLKASNLEKYGVENIAESPDVRRKIYQTNTERYGWWHYNPTVADITKALKTPEAITRFEKLHELKQDPNKREELYDFITENYTGSQYYVNLNKYGFRDPKYRFPSRIEVKLKNWLESKNIEFVENYYPEWMRNPETNRVRELDFWLPKHNMAIELNGDYTHSIEYGRDENYHKFKFIKCYENNVKLLMFTESEIVNAFDKVCNVIEHHLTGVDIGYDVDAVDKFRFALVDQSIDDSTKVEIFEISEDCHHFYPIKS